MPPPIDSPVLHLSVIPGTYFVDQLGPNDPIPSSVLEKLSAPTSSGFWAISRTSDEITIVGQEENRDYTSKNEPLDKWSCLMIKGPMPFGLVGVLSSLTEPLKKAKIPVFAQSTWNTDYLLVNLSRLDEAKKVLKEDGWVLVD